MFSGCKRALQARYCGRLSPHALSNLCLGKASLLARLKQSIQESRFFALNTLNFGAHAGTTHQFLDQLIMHLHV